MLRAARALLTVAVVLPTVASVPSASPRMAEPVEDVRILPLGDSITGSTGCWRAVLWRELADADYSHVDFVGGRQGPDCGDSYDDDSAGYSGFQATELAEEDRLERWLSREDPDIVMMHLGSNDVRHGKDVDDIVESFSVLVAKMREHNPRMVILAARPIRMTEEPMGEDCGECPGLLRDLAERMPAWARSADTPDSPVVVVDQWDGFDPDEDTYDGLHSNDSGADKMAARWFDALTEVLPEADTTNT